jgi:hypothetical protein
MICRAIVMASTMFCASACVAQEVIPAPVPATGEIARTYRVELYDLFRCVVSLTPQLRKPLRGWAMTYTDEIAYIEAAGLTEIRFRPVSMSETQVLIRGVGNPYRLFFPGKWLATADACARSPDSVDASSLPTDPSEIVRTRRRARPIRARM